MTEYHQIVNFTVGEVGYGVPVDQVREVRDCQEVTPVPGSPHWVEGVTNLRGQIITIVDLSKRLNLPHSEGGRGKIIVVETSRTTVGVIVDSVTEVSDIDKEDVSNNIMTEQGTDYIIGIGKQDNTLVVMLDLTKIVEDAGAQVDMTPYMDMMVTA